MRCHKVFATTWWAHPSTPSNNNLRNRNNEDHNTESSRTISRARPPQATPSGLVARSNDMLHTVATGSEPRSLRPAQGAVQESSVGRPHGL